MLHVRLLGGIRLDPQPGAQLLETAFCGKQQVRTKEAEHPDEDGRNLKGFLMLQTIKQDRLHAPVRQTDTCRQTHACETDGGEGSHRSRAEQVLQPTQSEKEPGTKSGTLAHDVDAT